jgi:hypothetical protein
VGVLKYNFFLTRGWSRTLLSSRRSPQRYVIHIPTERVANFPMQYKQIQISQLPDEMLRDIRERIRWHSAVMLCQDGDDIKVVPCAGTFCRIENHIGIITAKHVWDNPNPEGDGGITHHKKLKICVGGGAYDLDTEWLSAAFPEATGKKFNAITPDIAFVQIPSRLSSDFEAFNKIFYSIDNSIQKFQNDLYNFDGVWFTFGSPIERLNVVEAESPSVTYVTDIADHYQESEWDYISLNVISEKGKMPENVGGMSGGGIWRAKFSMTKDLKEFSLHAVMFSGVNFYQTNFGKKYQILGHGPMSIYKNLYNLVSGKS